MDSGDSSHKYIEMPYRVHVVIHDSNCQWNCQRDLNLVMLSLQHIPPVINILNLPPKIQKKMKKYKKVSIYVFTCLGIARAVF